MNDTSVSIYCVLAFFLKISKIKIAKFSTREISYLNADLQNLILVKKKLYARN